jgi:hypothetical protein
VKWHWDPWLTGLPTDRATIVPACPIGSPMTRGAVRRPQSKPRGCELPTFTPSMIVRRSPPGFIVPARPVEQDRPPKRPQWVHEIKHDGYRLIVRRHGAMVRLCTRRAVDYTDRLPLIAAAAARLKADSFTIDGEAVVIRPDGLSRFDELRRLENARRAVLYAFDLIEHDGEDLRNYPFLDRKTALARLLRGSNTGILLNEQSSRMAPRCSLTPANSAPRALCRSGSMRLIGPGYVRRGSRSTARRASLSNVSAARAGTSEAG